MRIRCGVVPGRWLRDDALLQNGYVPNFGQNQNSLLILPFLNQVTRIWQREKEKEDTPLIKQYYKFKAACPEALLLMRVGDFYETYGEDAVTTSKVLGIVQTRKSNGDQGYIELAGFPHHSLQSYMPKLVRAGYKVAVCDQLEDPKFAKKLVKEV